MRPPRALGHVDADCFYVSAERVRDRFLLGKPVGVLGNQGACVIAKSYELKAAKMTSGEPIGEAHREKRPARQGDGQWNGNVPFFNSQGSVQERRGPGAVGG
jgi:nucleotidyltransferase/DNA polymerase involved in DNA repair